MNNDYSCHFFPLTSSTRQAQAAQNWKKAGYLHILKVGPFMLYLWMDTQSLLPLLQIYTRGFSAPSLALKVNFMTWHWNSLLRRQSEWKGDGTSSFVSSQMNESCFHQIHISWLIDSLTELYTKTVMWAQISRHQRVHGGENLSWVKRLQKSWTHPSPSGEDQGH